MYKCNQQVEIKSPSFEELAYVVKLWSDPNTMEDVGGVVEFESNRHQSWYEKMVNPGDGYNVYCLIYNKKKEPIGEVSFHQYQLDSKTARLNIKIEAKHRGNGHAKEALDLMLDYYFNEFGGEVMLDDVANANGVQVLKKYGFEIISQSQTSTLLKLTKSKYNQLKNESK